MHLSLTANHSITIIEKGSARQVPIIEAVGKRKVFDLYGNERSIEVVKAPVQEKAVMTACTSGEAMVFGESHSLLVRKPNEGKWKRAPIMDITSPVLVQLPQRKIHVSPDLFDRFDIDDKGIFLEPQKATDMLILMRKAAWSGITVARRKAELRIDLERHRPSCYAAKLINGSFAYKLEESLGGLVGSGIVMPTKPFDDSYLQEIQKKGILMEGACVLNNAPLLVPRKLEKLVDVYHIILDEQSTPIELQWCHS